MPTPHKNIIKNKSEIPHAPASFAVNFSINMKRERYEHNNNALSLSQKRWKTETILELKKNSQCSKIGPTQRPRNLTRIHEFYNILEEDFIEFTTHPSPLCYMKSFNFLKIRGHYGHNNIALRLYPKWKYKRTYLKFK